MYSEDHIRIIFSLGIVLPGLPFTVFAGVRNLTADGELVSGKIVNLALYEWPATMPHIDRSTGELRMPSRSLKVRRVGYQSHFFVHVGQDCAFTSAESEVATMCTFTLPSVGKYALVGTTMDNSGYVVTTLLEVGKNMTEWEKEPLTSLNGIAFVEDKVRYMASLCPYSGRPHTRPVTRRPFRLSTPSASLSSLCAGALR